MKTAGRAPEIKVFPGVDGSVLDDFIAYTPSFRAGLFVAVADVNGDGKPDIITAPDGFYAFDPTFSGGVFVGGQ
jgi:hypothetical protein